MWCDPSNVSDELRDTPLTNTILLLTSKTNWYDSGNELTCALLVTDKPSKNKLQQNQEIHLDD